MTRVLHILSQRPGRSGSGVFLAAMVREAARRGYTQHAIVGGPPGTSASELPPLRDDELSPIIFPSDEAPFPVPGNSDVMPYPTTVFSRMSEGEVDQYLAASRRVMRRVRETFKPDIVHTHHLWLMTALARDVFDDIPIVATSHNAELRQMIKAPHLAPRVVPGVQKLDRICVLTPQSIDDTKEVFGVEDNKIALTGAGFDQEVFGQRPTANGQRLISFVGRLSTPKGIPFLIEATKDQQITLIGASGSGEDGQRMDELVHAAGARVVHTGAKQPHEVAELLRHTSVFVLPSLFEGLPLTMLEALASGCRAVVSALPTIASWVPASWRERGYVELVPPLAT
ncbi:MAG TPA: glycosyltransferase family 4 protein, partial [Thermoanaerobaculia bacterium]|nr:glycosyltransferase family 4 protein [Thermoanaerobaculia bacterium]